MWLAKHVMRLTRNQNRGHGMKSMPDMAPITCVVVYLLIACPALLQGAVEHEAAVCHGLGEFDRPSYNVSCKTARSSDLVAFRTLSYGYKADATCRPHAQREACCHTEFGDCVFQTNDHMADLLSYCAGAHTCYRRSRRESAQGRCLTTNDPMPYTTFGKVTYECVNVGLLVDVCDDHIKTNDVLHLAREIYYKTPVPASTACNCVITTACHTRVKLEAIAVNLVEQDGNCSKYLSIQDFYGGNQTLITCDNGYLHSFSTIFTSSGYGVRLTLFNESSHDRIWIKASAEDSEEEVSIHCGKAVNLPTDHEVECQTTRKTTATTYETTQITDLPSASGLHTTEDVSTINVTDTTERMSSTTQTSAGMQRANEMWYGWGIVGGVVAGIVLALVIILVAFIVWRRKKRPAASDNNPLYDPSACGAAGGSSAGSWLSASSSFSSSGEGRLPSHGHLATKAVLPEEDLYYNVELPPDKEATHPPDFRTYVNVTPESEWFSNPVYVDDGPGLKKAKRYNNDSEEDE